MVFHSQAFLFLFLPAAVALSRLFAARPLWRNGMLALTGMIFYDLAAGLAPLALLLAMSLVTFTAAALLARPAPRPRLLGLSLLGLNLAALAAFKVRSALGLGALPLGLSFYTFNLLSYGLDVHSRRVEPAGLPAFASYATFFPTLSAGPLLRFGDFQTEQQTRRVLDAGLLPFAASSLVVGLAKKVLVADPLGVAIEPLFASFERLGFCGAWLAVLGYAFQLYFDFSGYTDMATGLAALFGFRLPLNFDAPYTAVHITDFWQRWHMTMSRWFRDYLFLPLSRNLLRRSTSLESADRIRAQCLILTMILIGLWHGSTWSFLAWGLYHGLLLAGHARLRTLRALTVPRPVARALTLVAVLFGWVLLRSPSPAMALGIWGAMLGRDGWSGSVAGADAPLAAIVLVLLVITNTSLEKYLIRPSGSRLQSWLLAALLTLSLLSLGGRTPFLYFQF